MSEVYLPNTLLGELEEVFLKLGLASDAESLSSFRAAVFRPASPRPKPPACAFWVPARGLLEPLWDAPLLLRPLEEGDRTSPWICFSIAIQIAFCAPQLEKTSKCPAFPTRFASKPS